MGLSLKAGNCIAVGRSREFSEDLPPPGAMVFSAHSQAQGGFAFGSTPNRCPGEKPPAQGVQLAFFDLAQAPLQEHA